MNDEVRRWVEKADGDFRVARIVLGATDETAFDAVCFHAQQCVEKLMKAVLVSDGLEPPYTHNLLELCDLVSRSHPTWKPERRDLRYLTRGGVAFRYPGESATGKHAAKAMEICERLRGELLGMLGEKQ